MKSALIDPATLEFLSGLKQNNNRDWFNAHKDDYERARENFADFLDALIAATARFDESISWLEPEDCMFRIHRDLRFSRDKTPYKTALGAHLVANGRKVDKGLAGYYIHIEPGATRIACGAYQPPAPWLRNIRAAIDSQGAEFEAIVKAKAFKTCFGDLRGDTLKTVPRGYRKDHPRADWLKRKGFLAVHPIDDGLVLSKGFLEGITAGYKLALSLNNFLNAALPDQSQAPLL